MLPKNDSINLHAMPSMDAIVFNCTSTNLVHWNLNWYGLNQTLKIYRGNRAESYSQ